jgi:hypothetical protein
VRRPASLEAVGRHKGEMELALMAVIEELPPAKESWVTRIPGVRGASAPEFATR